MSTIRIAHASGSEKGTIRGTAGDQTGKEVCIRSWYPHSKGWVTLRCTVPGMADHIAYAGEVIAKDSNVGYDQYQNQTLWNLLKENGFDIKNIDTDVETDCARLMRVCIQYAAMQMGLNVTIPDFYTASMASVLVKTGLFEKLTAAKYNIQDSFLKRGDIQVTKTKGHTWVILDNGDKITTVKVYALGDRLLEKGCKGNDVEALQTRLNTLKFDCGKVDGEFGTKTEKAVEAFQKAAGINVDGQFGKESFKALKAMESYTKYTVKAGDSLWKIAAATLGKGSRYTEIVKLNNLTGSTIKVGQVLKIPKG